MTKSLNILIKKSKGNYIARQDSDDISMKDRFNTQINYLTDGKYDLCFTRAKLKDSGKFIPGLSYYIPPKVSIKYKNPFIHGSLMIKKSVLEKLNYYDENFYYAQDYKLFKDAMMNNYQIKYLNKAMYLLNTKENISTLNKNEQKYYADCIKKGVNP